MSKKNIFLINLLVIFGFLIVTGSVIYYFVIRPPIYEKERVINIDSCIKKINNESAKEWQNYPNEQATEEFFDKLQWKTNEQIKRCYIKYPPIR